MSTEADAVPLRDYIDLRVDSLRREADLRAAAIKDAIEKSDAAHEKRLDSVNEFRAQLDSVINTLMPRAESEKALQGTASKVTELNDRINRMDGRGAGFDKGWGYLVGFIGIIVGIGSLVVLIISKGH